MDEHRPALHVAAFYWCIWVFEATTLRLGRLDERVGVRSRAALASIRARFQSPVVPRPAAAAEADFVQR